VAFEKVVRILAEEIFSNFHQKKRNMYILQRTCKTQKYTLKKRWGVDYFFISFNWMFHNIHFNMTPTVLPSTWQHGIPGSKIKSVFLFPDLMRLLEISTGFTIQEQKKLSYMEG